MKLRQLAVDIGILAALGVATYLSWAVSFSATQKLVTSATAWVGMRSWPGGEWPRWWAWRHCRCAAAERARIAWDVHDAVAHGLSIVVIQAQAVSGAMERRPATARAALSSIVDVGRESLAEMRRLLGLTRPDGPELAPLPGLRDVPALVERVRAAGLPVSLQVVGETGPVSASVGLCPFRIVQEALTNALKHAGGQATVEVTVHCGANHPEATVRDTGRGSGGGRTSFGQRSARIRRWLGTGRPGRPRRVGHRGSSGFIGVMDRIASKAVVPAINGVSMRPVWMVLTRMPQSTSPSAALLEMPRSAHCRRRRRRWVAHPPCYTGANSGPHGHAVGVIRSVRPSGGRLRQQGGRGWP
ncbi:MAG: hypothetical protein J2P15_01535 [Micromonosporaceae bacterium]|nr:hypothetical protein [Micromonosporaceae bacterium]